MKLFYSATSPFVRKVMACAIARGIDGLIERVPVNAHASPEALTTANPLSKVPCLVTTDGLALYDSPVICEYLESVEGGLPLFPPTGAQRWRALKFQALGDGIMDAAVARRGEQGKPREDARDAFMARQKVAVDRGVAALEQDVPAVHLDIGTIAVACALGYLDFRFGAEPWREAQPRLAGWFEKIMAMAPLRDTVPKE